MSIMENIDMTKVVTVPDIQQTYSYGDPHWYDSIGDTDGDVEEFYQNIPEVATHWDEYNEKNWWDSRRFYNGKYEIVACTSTPEDYTYETVDSTNKWKEARRLEKEGADVYVNGERIHFVDHEAVDDAFEELKLDEIINFDVMCDTPFEADARRKAAEDTLKQNGIKLNKDELRKKINKRFIRDLIEANYGIPFHERSIVCAFNEKTQKYESTRINTEDLPF